MLIFTRLTKSISFFQNLFKFKTSSKGGTDGLFYVYGYGFSKYDSLHMCRFSAFFLAARID